MIEVCVLASGSSGNAYFFEADNKSFLVDCGITCKQIEERLDQIGKRPDKIKGIFITHEHIDHIRGTDVFSRKYNVPVYITKKCHNNSFFHGRPSFFNLKDSF